MFSTIFCLDAFFQPVGHGVWSTRSDGKIATYHWKLKPEGSLRSFFIAAGMYFEIP